MNITLEQAKVVTEAAQAESGGLGLNPITVVVLDSGGHVVAAERQDGSPRPASRSLAARRTVRSPWAWGREPS
ncbi:heme-binding protein [uncultured Phycicoccus sp.]|uniref:heme-binding protein n=1 Tax=uncultured Phycicoccus sp. TaxID=661422 RepID=UPI0026325C0D|nr:heme-binding protein [uncultured Phycicoccus sp.]